MRASPRRNGSPFRIGINVGDIIIEGNDIFGDGVNIAARLETLCEPGGLCISRAVRDQVRDKLSVMFDDLGEQEVKNIVRPVRVFGLTPNGIAAVSDLPQSAAIGGTRRSRIGMFTAFSIVLSIAGVTMVIVTHELNFAREIGDFNVFMDEG